MSNSVTWLRVRPALTIKGDRFCVKRRLCSQAFGKWFSIGSIKSPRLIWVYNHSTKELPMKAAVCYAFGQPLVVEEVEIDPPQPGEVKVRLAATAICHSDVHLIRGEWGGDLPVVAGHEAAGIVEAAGENVTLAQPGDAVVVSLLRSCGRCFYCATGSSHMCEGTFALATESRLRNQRGERLRHGIRTAAFAEYA